MQNDGRTGARSGDHTHRHLDRDDCADDDHDGDRNTEPGSERSPRCRFFDAWGACWRGCSSVIDCGWPELHSHRGSNGRSSRWAGDHGIRHSLRVVFRRDSLCGRGVSRRRFRSFGRRSRGRILWFGALPASASLSCHVLCHCSPLPAPGRNPIAPRASRNPPTLSGRGLCSGLGLVWVFGGVRAGVAEGCLGCAWEAGSPGMPGSASHGLASRGLPLRGRRAARGVRPRSVAEPEGYGRVSVQPGSRRGERGRRGLPGGGVSRQPPRTARRPGGQGWPVSPAAGLVRVCRVPGAAGLPRRLVSSRHPRG